MKGKTATLAGAAALAVLPAIAAAGPAHGPAVPVASSYAELFTPIPNATGRLALADAQDAQQPGRLIEAQYDQNAHHHQYNRNAHHHHHRSA
ncbi:MAG: hypothetical protein ACRED8_08205 [Caulobacteraceae bacterium]